jgi:diguanylate cyclase (GGDEF)-like protein
MSRATIREWLRLFAQPVTYLGITMLVLMYAALAYLLVEDARNAEAEARRNNENLALLFEQSVLRSLKSADGVIQLLRRAYRSDPTSTDLDMWVTDPEIKNDLIFQFSIIGPDGFIKASSYGAPAIGLFAGERPHFQVHVDATEDRVFVSEPIVLKTSGKRAIFLTRRIDRSDGAFNGVLSASFDITQLEKFYRSISLGENGFVSIMGLDGVIRAAGANGEPRMDLVGRKLTNAGVLKRVGQAASGSYWNAPSADSGRIDGIKRLVSYRMVEGYPLIAIVANSEAAIFKNVKHNATIYWAITAAITLVILVAIGIGVVRERELSRTASSLMQSKMWLETALENMPHGLCMFDARNRLIICNRLYGEMYGLQPEQLRPGTALDTVLEARIAAGNTPKDIERYRNARVRDAYLPAPRYIVDEMSDGRVIAINRRAMPGGGLVAVHQDVTAQKATEAEITHLAHYDGLTDLANRTLFLQCLSRAMSECRSGAQFALYLLDIDRFKDVNDSLGHLAGDALLQEIAGRLRACLTESDAVARLGGDEFAVLRRLEGGAGEVEALQLADRLLRVISQPVDIYGDELIVETSIGVVLAPEHGIVADELLKKADLALYRAKSSGRNTRRLFAVEMEVEAQARLTLAMELRNALARGDFELHYQPIVAIESNTIVAMEALLRWPHPQRGMIPPGDFIPLAEDTGLINPLGEWVLRRACRDAAAWPAHVKVSINLSPVQFERGDLVTAVVGALSQAQLSADRLELEVTESLLLHHNDETLGILHRLQELGAAIALDDFGTGYSSLSYLQRFPFDKIKIDRTFVAELTQRPDCLAIVSAVTGLARCLDMATTAEGVETAEQLALLRAAGCREAQGFLLGRPQPVGEIVWPDPVQRAVACG